MLKHTYTPRDKDDVMAQLFLRHSWFPGFPIQILLFLSCSGWENCQLGAAACPCLVCVAWAVPAEADRALPLHYVNCGERHWCSQRSCLLTQLPAGTYLQSTTDSHQICLYSSGDSSNSLFPGKWLMVYGEKLGLRIKLSFQNKSLWSQTLNKHFPLPVSASLIFNKRADCLGNRSHANELLSYKPESSLKHPARLSQIRLKAELPLQAASANHAQRKVSQLRP